MWNINVMTGRASEYPRAGWLVPAAIGFVEVSHPACGRVTFEYLKDNQGVFIEAQLTNGHLYVWDTDSDSWDDILDSLANFFDGTFYSLVAGICEHGI